MDAWPEMNRLERDIARIAAVTATAIALAGAAVGWTVRFFTERHHQ
jgi:hypothetical protein